MPNYTSAPELTDSYLETVWETLPRFIRPTFFLSAPALFARLGCDLTIASETFQYTGSFKFRAAYNLLSSIPQQRVVAASSGNFGQAVAYASQLLGKSSVVVMQRSCQNISAEANGTDQATTTRFAWRTMEWITAWSRAIRHWGGRSWLPATLIRW